MVTFGFDSVHFFQNTRSSLGICGLLIVLLLFASWRLGHKNSRRYMLNSILVLLKTLVYMVFVISATIQLRYNNDEGLQTAIAILVQCFLSLCLPIYFIWDGCRQRKCPTRQNLSLALRGLTCAAVVWGTDFPDYQFLFLMFIHIGFVYFCAARFGKYSTARSTGLVYSYGLLPILIFSLRFDDSGISPVVLSCLILISSTVFHVWYRDWMYQFYLLKLKKNNLKEHQETQTRRQKNALKIKKNREEQERENPDFVQNGEESNPDDNEMG